MKIVKILLIIVAAVVVLVVLGGVYVNFALPNVGEAPQIKIPVTASRIERGRYLANHVSVCIDCHSQRDWSLFSGPLVPGTEGMGGGVFDENAGFPGKIYAPNITPHHLNNYSDGELLKAITTGENKEGKALFPLMAYNRFGKMDREDLYSIIAYIRTLKPLDNKVPQTTLNFPVNLINKTMPGPADFQQLPSKSDTLKYGGYLVNAAGCMDCHSKVDKGAIIKGTEFGGGMEFRQPAGVIRSTNITMHPKYGIGKWTKADFVNRFKVYADSAYRPAKVGRDELNSPMPWTMFAGMTTDDLGAIYTYLKSIKPLNNEVQTRTMQKH